MSLIKGFDLVWEVKEIDEYFDITNDLEKIRESDKAKKDATKELKELSDYFDGRMDNTGVIETIKEMKPNNYVYSKDVFYGWTGDKWINNHVPLHMEIIYGIPKYWNKKLTYNQNF